MMRVISLPTGSSTRKSADEEASRARERSEAVPRVELEVRTGSLRAHEEPAGAALRAALAGAGAGGGRGDRGDGNID